MPIREPIGDANGQSARPIPYRGRPSLPSKEKSSKKGWASRGHGRLADWQGGREGGAHLM